MIKKPNKLPKRLKPGATIGIVAPAGSLRCKDSFERGIRLLHELGFSTKFPKRLWPGDEYLSDTDENRAKEFNAMWFDHEVDAIMAARGGYGCLRIADNIDFTSFSQLPKPFVGFSDLTLLHSCLQARSNIVSLHGPVVTSLANASHNDIIQFKNTLCTDLKHWKADIKVEILRGGTNVCGLAAGGNLSTILSTLGTPLQPDWRGCIVFLEDTSEHPYRIDRMLTQLHLSGVLDQASALVLGDFSHGLSLDRTAAMRHHETIWKRTLELTAKTATPVWADFPMGHGRNNITIPMGMDLLLDNSKARLEAC